MPYFLFILGLVLTIFNLLFLFHWVAVGSLLALISLLGVLGGLSIMRTAYKILV